MPDLIEVFLETPLIASSLERIVNEDSRLAFQYENRQKPNLL